MGPLVNARQLERVSGYMKVGGGRGREGGRGRRAAPGRGLDRGFFFQPTVFTNVKPDMRVAQEEIFGPGRELREGEVARGGDRGQQRHAVRAVVLDLHQQRERRVHGDARSRPPASCT